jgi:hypothetical protein
MTREIIFLAKLDRVRGNRRRPYGVKGRLEFRDEVGFEGTNFQTVPYFLFSNLVWQLEVSSSVSGHCSYASLK